MAAKVIQFPSTAKVLAEFIGKAGESVRLAFGPSVLDLDGLSVHPAALPEAYTQSFEQMRHLLGAIHSKVSDPRHLGRLLRLGGERRDTPAGHRAVEVFQRRVHLAADEHLDGLDLRHGHLIPVLEAVLPRAGLVDAEPRVRVDGHA